MVQKKKWMQPKLIIIIRVQGTGILLHCKTMPEGAQPAGPFGGWDRCGISTPGNCPSGPCYEIGEIS